MKKEEKEIKKDFKYYLKEFSPYIITIVLVLLFKQYYFSPIMVNGESMYDTLHDKDIMILDRVSLRHNDLKRFDIVVIQYRNKYLIKRVIGLPGEEVEYKDSKLYINGEYVEENFLGEDVITPDYKLPTEKVPDGFYFVVGDNRTNSNDSRYLGCFSLNKIYGVTSFTVFPFDRFGSKK